jgi:hypothetical protein
MTSASTIAEVLQLVQPWLNRHRRPMWQPVTTRWKRTITSSRFGGEPWLMPDEDWPACPHCGRRKTFFVQLDLDELPDVLHGRFGSGLLQLFYCTNTEDHCDVDLPGWEAYAAVQTVRIVHPPPQGRSRKYRPSRADVFPVRFIKGWKTAEDLPSSAESEQLGLEFRFSGDEGMVDVLCPEDGEHIE